MNEVGTISPVSMVPVACSVCDPKTDSSHQYNLHIADDWAADLGEDTGPGADDAGEDDWDLDLDAGDTAADTDGGHEVDWQKLGNGAGGDAVAMLAAGAPTEEKPSSSPKEAEDASRAKHIQRQKMRAAEEERARDAAAAAMTEGPLDDPEAEKARIKQLQEERELEIMAETLGLDEEDGAEATPGVTAPASDVAAAASSAAAAAVGWPVMPATTAECVRIMPIAGKAWSDLGGMLIERAQGERNKLVTSKFIKGVMRAAVSTQVLTADDLVELKEMMRLAEANVKMEATAKAQGRTKKKQKKTLGRQGQQMASGRLVASDADMLGMASGSSARAPAPAPAPAGDEDDDDFM